MLTTRAVKEGHRRLIILGKDNHHAQVEPGKRLIDLLTELGAEGWEMTGVLDFSSVEEPKGEHDIRLTSSSIFLKRALE